MAKIKNKIVVIPSIQTQTAKQIEKHKKNQIKSQIINEK